MGFVTILVILFGLDKIMIFIRVELKHDSIFFSIYGIWIRSEMRERLE